MKKEVNGMGKKKEKVYFAIDLGNKHVKVKSEKKEERFPSRMIDKYMLGSQRFNFGVQSDYKKEFEISEFNLLNDDTTYLVGKDIDKLNKGDNMIETLNFGLKRYKNNAEFEALMSYSIAFLSKDYEEATKSVLEVELMIGLPTEDFTMNIIEEVMKLTKKQHSVIIDGVTYNVLVTKTSILPQPMGTLYDLLISDKLEERNVELIDGNVAIIDFGGGTQIYDCIHNFVLDPNNRVQKKIGTYTLFKRIADKVDVSPAINDFEVENLLRNKTKDNEYIFSRNSKEHLNLTEDIQEELNQTTKQVIRDTKSAFKNGESIELYAFTGGGANLLNQKMVKKSLDRVLFVKDSEYANVRGFYKYLMVQG